MKATIVGIESGRAFIDGMSRITLKFESADPMFDRLRFRVDAVGLEGVGTGPHLDQELEVDLQGRARRGGK